MQNVAEYAVERTAGCGGTRGAKYAGMRRETPGGISSEVPRGIYGEVSGGQDCPAFYGVERYDGSPCGRCGSRTIGRRAGVVDGGAPAMARRADDVEKV